MTTQDEEQYWASAEWGSVKTEPRGALGVRMRSQARSTSPGTRPGLVGLLHHGRFKPKTNVWSIFKTEMAGKVANDYIGRFVTLTDFQVANLSNTSLFDFMPFHPNPALICPLVYRCTAHTVSNHC